MVQIGENEPTKVEILVKALNREVATYTLEIYTENSNTNLKKVTVDGNKAEISKIAENTYEYTLDKKVDTITIGAIAEETKTKVGINTNEQEEGATYRKIKMEGKRIVVNIPVTAEDGTTKTYTLIINALPDNVNLLSVKVEGKTAEAVPVNQYEARVNKNATSFELYVIPEDPKAKVQIDNNIKVTGTASATIPKNTDKAEVKIKVTAQDGTTEEYTLIVTNQSDDCKLAILKVDGEILEPDEQGKYHVTKKFLTESVEVEAIANNSYAQININTLKAVQEEQKATVTTPDAQNTITITVTAEDGTAKKYTLIVEKLPNNTEAEITIIYKEDETVKIKDIEIDENNKGTIRIGKQEEVDIKVIAKDKLAQISIKGGLNTEHQVTEKIITTEETTKVPVQVTAQDGTIRNYEITIIKASNNNNLEKLEAEGINQSDITQVSENKYEIKMPDTMNNLKLKGTAENKYATVKIAEGTYSTNNIQEETIEITTYFEPVLSSKEQDYSHPAFNNLFLITSYDEDTNSLIVKRKKRGINEQELYLATTLSTNSETIGDLEYEINEEKRNQYDIKTEKNAVPYYHCICAVCSVNGFRAYWSVRAVPEPVACIPDLSDPVSGDRL